MRFAVAALICFSSLCFAESEKQLLNRIALVESQVAQAQSRLRTAEQTLKNNTDALARSRHSDDQKFLRSNLAGTQNSVNQERTQIAAHKRELDALQARLAATRAQHSKSTADLNPQPMHSTHVAQPVEGVSAPRSPKLIAVVLKDGRTLECLRYMEVENDYALQMPDKKFQNVRKSDVARID